MQKELLARIEVREFSINLLVAQAGHQFFVRYNEMNQPIYELHGVAVDRISGEFKEVSFGQGDLLKVAIYSPQESHANYSITNFSGLYQPGQPSKTLLAGSEEAIDQRWNEALEAAKVLNFRNIKYDPTGGKIDDCNSGNSNSVARTLYDIMGFSPEKLQNAVFGLNKNLLPIDQVEAYKDLYHHGEPTQVMISGGDCVDISSCNIS